MLHRFLGPWTQIPPRGEGQWALSPLVPAKVGSVVRMFVFVEKQEGLWTVIIFLPSMVNLGKRGGGKIPSSTAMYQATSPSLNQPARLLVLFNKIFGVSVLFWFGSVLSFTKNAENK